MRQDQPDAPCISGHFLFHLYRTCLALGARKPILLAALELTEAELRNPATRFSRTTASTLYRATVMELGNDRIYSDIGAAMVPQNFSEVSYRAMFGETVGDVVRDLVAALEFGAAAGHANGPGFGRNWLRFELTPESCRLYWEPEHDLGSDLVKLLFSMIAHVSADVIGHGTSLIKAAYFRYKEPQGFGDFVSFGNHPIAVPCLFNHRQTFLELHRPLVDRPNPRHNPVLLQAREAQLGLIQQGQGPLPGGPRPLATACYEYLFFMLDKSGLSLDCAAETFGMAERTLRRRLASEGASFRQILERVRRDTCQLYFLEGNRSLSEIATLLGYSELSAFTRAYNGWHGHPPSHGLAARLAMAA